MRARLLLISALAGWLALPAASSSGRPRSGPATAAFSTSHECLACHNGLSAPSGQDVSIGTAWRASMMAHSARDPYWMAGVRRETLDHPTAAAAIEHECAVCHLPMAHTLAAFAGAKGRLFGHLFPAASDVDRLAQDGVSCSLCHQIRQEGLGTRDSFTGGFVVARPGAPLRPAYGPRAVTSGLGALMRSASGFMPVEAPHVRQSELCATCHTLITHALGPKGEVVGELPEQVPYLEWRHSAYAERRSCQSCHMPAVAGPAPIASVLGEPRPGLTRHTLVGGNAFMLRMLNRQRRELGVEALPQELENAALTTLDQLRVETASLAIARAALAEGRIEIEVVARNRTGHKLPTGYPSRRAWLHLLVSDAQGKAVFESGAVSPEGRIDGNDNDADPSRFEAHHLEITTPDQVQVYEAIMADPAGAVTTGLLRGVRYLKDNRLLPRGFEKATAGAEISVQGGAMADPDFDAEGDRVRYRVDAGAAAGPFLIEAQLLYQSIAFRWAENLRAYDAPEPQQFLSFYGPMASSSVVTLAADSAVAR